MSLGERPSFLTLQSNLAAPLGEVTLNASYSGAISGWTAATRVSPVWGLSEFRSDAPLDDKFVGRHHLLFLGPVQVARLWSDVAAVGRKLARQDVDDLDVWVSTGCFNLVLRVWDGKQSEEIVSEIVDWAKGASMPFEVWNINDGRIESAPSCNTLSIDTDNLLRSLALLAKQASGQLLEQPLQEYCALMASAGSRAAMMVPELHGDLCSVNSSIEALLQKYRSGVITELDMQSRLLSINAAVSRFSSQAFSGVPPIAGTECHFWVHSLLGTGAANLALAKLTKFVDATVGEWRLPERLNLLQLGRENVPSLGELMNHAVLFDNDVLGDVQVDVDETMQEPIVPIVTYFSGRDGFSSHLQTLSAPLTTITDSNSYHYSLLTITHELSHIFVQGILGVLYPDIENPADIAATKAMLKPGYQAETWLDAARQLLVEGIAAMEQTDRGVQIRDASIADEQWIAILKSWRKEVQELMVHSFDYLYFYGNHKSSVRFYIESIWKSWSAIPDIGERIPNYVLRTLCAISAPLLELPVRQRAPAAKQEIEQVLRDVLSEKDLPSDYVERALKHLDTQWNGAPTAEQLEKEYLSRLYIIRLVKVFLYSPKLAAELHGDWRIGRADDNYGKAPTVFNTEVIGNPIRFLTGCIKEKTTDAESLWVLHALAFDCKLPSGD